MTKFEIDREMARVQAQIEGPEGKGRLTILKAYYRKLYTMRRKAA